MKRGPWIVRKVLKVIVIVAVAVLVFGFIVMNLWNAIVVPVLHAGTINFAQALGIILLSKILFGGFRGGWGGPGRGRWQKMESMKQKWMAMTPEEREKLKAQYRGRCGSWGRGTREGQSENERS